MFKDLKNGCKAEKVHEIEKKVFMDMKNVHELEKGLPIEKMFMLFKNVKAIIRKEFKNPKEKSAKQT